EFLKIEGQLIMEEQSLEHRERQKRTKRHARTGPASVGFLADGVEGDSFLEQSAFFAFCLFNEGGELFALSLDSFGLLDTASREEQCQGDESALNGRGKQHEEDS